MSKDIIGVIGGMGSYATAYFFGKFLEEFPAQKEWERPRMIIDNNCVMPSRVRAILYHENTAELIDALSTSVNGLAAMGCNKMILACITSHYFLPFLKIKTPSSFELIDLLAATASKINEEEVFVFCTEGTTQSQLWNQYFSEKTRLIYPNDEALQELRLFIEAVKQNIIIDEVIK